MTEDDHRKWDIIFKWLGLAGAIFAAMWTAYTYRQSRATDLQHDKEIREENKKSHTKDQNSFIFQHQASLYFDAANSAAILALGFDPNGRDKGVENATSLATARQKFEELYWGDLVIVEDRRIEMAMVAFRECLLKKGVECKRPEISQDSKPISKEVLSELGEPILQNLSLELAACMRSSLQDERGIEFEDLTDMQMAGEVRKRSAVCPYD